jgi:hypothetical protein
VPGVQAVAYVLRAQRLTAPLGPGDHGSGGGDSGDAGETERLPQADLS